MDIGADRAVLIGEVDSESEHGLARDGFDPRFLSDHSRTTVQVLSVTFLRTLSESDICLFASYSGISHPYLHTVATYNTFKIFLSYYDQLDLRS